MDRLIQKILNDQQVGFAVVNREFCVEEFSDNFARFAHPEEQVSAGRRLDELYPEMLGIADMLAALFETPEKTFELPCVNRELQTGEICFLDLKLGSLPVRPGQEPRLLFMVSDKTDQYQMQQQILQQKHEILLLKSVLGTHQQFLANSILGNSPPIVRLKELVHKVAQVPSSTVLLQGESGTGKSHVARVLHYLSFQSGAPFVEVNCAAIPESLLEAELFGYEKGAFTTAIKSKKGLIEEADGGTLFLDEIVDMPLNLQAKLLHFLETRKFRRLGSNQERSVQVRCIAATNRDLKAAVDEKKFREDLYYRINVVSLTLPPLRQLEDDVIILAEHFVKIYNLDFKKKVTGLHSEAHRLLKSYDWPGNVRELRNVIERAMIFCDTAEIKPADLSLRITANETPPRDLFVLPEGGIQLEELEKSLLIQALQRASGNKTRAATLLGLSRDTFRYRLEKFGIE
ncbi:MAG: sigma-54 dependent transcriptional regulator [candidate division KSB1 bacterium]|nr:sigma-54 dependent transcriptional regulator [candidate division KSB1 bacterium]MDZ7300872.1 sigma-54 dependent transcriptional regulator [candidate division KSB1 bacterium]MDZ7309858.1 sigma-54 dependent transcriptional regulator [candidate division KSB1 bacterium]